MTEEKKKIGECTVGCSEEVFHLLILVAGTTDPINTFTDAAHRAISYKHKDTKKYWDKAFYDGINELVASTLNASLFDMHGWSGDNRKGNREVAGAYLVNRLVGANKEKAFYGPSYKKKKVYIHLVGHSHGGNVMNEMTQQIYKLGKQWPATWKIKSFTYLSTPFFQKLHKVKVGDFVHPQAEVLNAYNDYDYTQRMLADFSLFTLHEAVVVNQITETAKGNIEKLMAASKAVPWQLANPKSNYWLDKDEGRQLYTATRDLLGATTANSMSVVKFLQSIEAIAVGLNKPVEYKVNPAVQANNTVSHSFKLLSDSNLANLKTVIAALTANITLSVRALQEGIDANNYSRVGFASAFLRGGLPLANNLAAFLNVPAGALNVTSAGVLWQTLVGVLSDAIEVFDDTGTKPDTQFNGSRPITPLDVTARDKYHDSTQKANCIKLIAKLEALEKRVSAKPQANLLFDLVLILLVHNPQVRGIATMFNDWAGYIDWFEYAATGDVDVAAKALHATMTNLANALLSRFVGEIEDSSDTQPDEDSGKRGSLPYLLKESHSTSRRVLHPEVKAFLKRMMVK
jgi:hypothetical protein